MITAKETIMLLRHFYILKTNLTKLNEKYFKRIFYQSRLQRKKKILSSYFYCFPLLYEQIPICNKHIHFKR
jgi:hypothetical protein